MSEYVTFSNGKTYRVATGTRHHAIGGLFRLLTDDEEADFREWAHLQPMGTEINPLWHPAIQDELFRLGRGREAGQPED